MKDKENCEIIKDLLPNYVDDLTSEATRRFVQKHLKECKECNVIYENMKKDIEKEKQVLKKEVKYAKKYNRKIKLLFIIIFLILLIIFSFTFVRNAIIISSLTQKANKYEDCDNYHVIWSTHSKNEITVFEVYCKNEKYVETLYNFNYEMELSDKSTFYYDGNNQLISYYNGDKTIRYDEVDKGEFPGEAPFPPNSITQITMYTENPINFIMECFINQITLEKCNGIQCYRLKRYFDDTNILYVDKNTGITARGKSGIKVSNNYRDTFSDIIYELNTVTDEDVEMPSIEGYTVVKR